MNECTYDTIVIDGQTTTKGDYVKFTTEIRSKTPGIERTVNTTYNGKVGSISEYFVILVDASGAEVALANRDECESPATRLIAHTAKRKIGWYQVNLYGSNPGYARYWNGSRWLSSVDQPDPAGGLSNMDIASATFIGEAV